MKSISYQDAINEPLISAEVEAEAIRRWQEEKHTDSLEILLKSHARIAYSMASQYASNQDQIQDLAAEGMIGLMKAADKFDPSKNTRFATYCYWWIMTMITTGLPKVSAVIDVPARTFIDARMGRLVGPDADKAHMAVYGGINLDAPISEEDGGMTAMDKLECPRMNPEDSLAASSEDEYRVDVLKQALDELEPREREVVIRRKLATEPETLEQISKDIGVTRERVRQLESRAFTRLRRSLLAKGFSPAMLRE